MHISLWFILIAVGIAAYFVMFSRFLASTPLSQLVLLLTFFRVAMLFMAIGFMPLCAIATFITGQWSTLEGWIRWGRNILTIWPLLLIIYLIGSPMLARAMRQRLTRIDGGEPDESATDVDIESARRHVRFWSRGRTTRSE